MKLKFSFCLFFLFTNTIVVSQSILPFDNSNLHKDSAGNIINLTTGTVYKDLGNGTVIDFINQYTTIKISKDAKINYKGYNWDLNE